MGNISTNYIMISPCNVVSAPPLQCFTGGAASPGSAVSVWWEGLGVKCCGSEHRTASLRLGEPTAGQPGDPLTASAAVRSDRDAVGR